MRADGAAACDVGRPRLMLLLSKSFPLSRALAGVLGASGTSTMILLATLAGEGVFEEASLVALISGRSKGTGAASCNCMHNKAH